MDVEKIKVQLIHINGERSNGEFYLFEEAPHNSELVLLQLFYDERQLFSESGCFFDALISIREELEKDNILIACNGATENVFTSPMQLSMGVGRKVYKLTVGEQARVNDVVDIFEFEKELRSVSICAQAEYYRGWLDSLT
ncbi:hypothetical protein MHH56_22440 [Paenibacillus sp. FSL K6-3182]|uniref:hypothetical protein n=1 Tax=Paenibacillus sp. FSL K6-3182 TaxID=2921495 RepID=UPI0030CCAE99